MTTTRATNVWLAAVWLALAAAAVVLILQTKPTATAFVSLGPTESPRPTHTARPARTPRPTPPYDDVILLLNLNKFAVEGFCGRGVPTDIAFDIVRERLAKGEFVNKADAEQRLGEYAAYFVAIGSLR